MNVKVLLRRGVLPLVLLAALVLCADSAQAGRHEFSSNGRTWTCGDADIRIEDDYVLVICDDRDRTRVEITDKSELFIDDEQITITEAQREILKNFFDNAQLLKIEAIKIGKEGARIGLKGAKLGLSAVGKVFKLLSPHYDSDDLEREIEAEAEKLEREAEKLEKRAEAIEDIVEELDDLAYELEREIPELRRLRWF